MHENKHVPYERPKDSFMESSQLMTATSLAGLKQRIIDSDWGGYALDLELWKDSKSPVVKLRPSEVSLNDKERLGFLSDRLIGIGSSYLRRSPESGRYILNKCILKDRNLTDITMLRYHRHLQYINIANNNISCLSPLSGLLYLIYLNASHNRIEHLSDFAPPWYLTYINLSYNYLTDIGDLRNCWNIVRLNLSHNILESISGLENLKHLQYLNLSYNLIECIENLDGLNLRELNLEGNCITSFRSVTPGRGINVLPNLRIILLGYNRLSTLSFFKDTYSLRFVDLKFNRIADLLEVLNLTGSIFEIDFRGNTCTKWPNYRNVLISSIPSIKFIDSVEVLEEEKVISTILFASPLDLTAARKVAKLTLLEQLNITKIDAHVQPYDEISLPLIILTGPLALMKMTLALHVAQTISDKVILATSSLILKFSLLRIQLGTIFQIISRLELPTYGVIVRPQNEATTTDIILQSKTMLPKTILQRSEAMLLEKKRIALREAWAKKHSVKSLDRMSFEERTHTTERLKV
ncbi:leucine-rich repeat-containing protein 23 isoform X4 [Monomorium pharaonis]|uniref:leucine-rich repeat-containing protein 23 isoform X4 n=1 Tax=Monomorium pharaonis TaxID=307658 RepID=UPI0017469508|nr:leucine-rich repeat-containing protein 23 isoform X4 [Monomorium pharaonis]